MKKLLILFLLIPLLLSALEVEFDRPIIRQNKFWNDLPVLLEVGNPAVPYVPVKILLPMGSRFEKLNLSFHYLNSQLIEELDFVREPQPISLPVPDHTKRNEQIYNSDSSYPTQDFQILGTQRYKGYDLLLVNIFPYKYNSRSGELIWFEKASLELITQADISIAAEQNDFLIKSDEMRAALERIALNVNSEGSYNKTITASSRTLVDPADPHTLVIITDEERAPFFDDFIAWKNDQGIVTALFTTNDIYTEYTGFNDPEKIRNFIIDAYQTYSATDTPLEHVILGGDDEIIPIRSVFIDTGYGTMDSNMPCDAYFSCLDGTWDGNGNWIYGEVDDNVDLIPEIAVGRITAETQSEFNRFFHKTYHYVDEITVSNDIHYGLGENLNWNPLTWGGDYIDEVFSEVPGIEADYHVFKLYDRDGTYSTQNVKDAINSGVAVINHMGHSNEYVVFGQNSGHCASYSNTEYGFAYSQGCYPAAFDEATSQTSESIAENLIIAEGGLFAFVGNTRYGWYSPGSTNGPSQPYDIEFFRAIFTNDIREVGSALSESRVVLANQAASNAFLRWVHYQLVLLGDPSVEVKYANGGFPYLVPGIVVYDDSSSGDGDGIPNPGEEIEIYIELENLEGWSDATAVSASLQFEDSTIQIINGSVDYGFIAGGTAVTSSSPFIVQVPQNCSYSTYNYTLTVTSPISGDIYFTKDYTLGFQVSLFQKNWPWFTSNSIISNPIIYDFNDNDIKDVMIIEANARINLLDADANMIDGYPWNNNENIWKSTALGDIDSDGLAEIIIASRTGRILAYDNSGMEILNYQLDSDQLFTPMIADFTGNGQNEIVSYGLDRNLNMITANGTMAANFPVEMSMLNFYEMAAADLNGNGAYEILIGSMNGQLHAVGSDGADITGFPVQLSSAICTAPIVLDNQKIAIGTSDYKLFIIDDLGNILIEKPTGNKIAASPIAADFDNDGQLEIAFVTISGKAFIVKQDGSDLAGWPVETGCSVINPPLTADIDNDDNLELIFFSGNNEMFVFHHDGTEVAFAPVPVNMICTAPASLEDIDGDGDFEVITGLSTGVLIIDIKLPKGTKTPWKTYRGNYQRTGNYNDNELFTSVSETVPPLAKAVLNQNFPNPFNPATTISFALYKNENVDLNIYNIRGQKVKTLINSLQMDKGDKEVIWNGTDDSGKPVSTGIYFYKLKTDSKVVDIRKCLLLK